jgi:hypothetical protein
VVGSAAIFGFGIPGDFRETDAGAPPVDTSLELGFEHPYVSAIVAKPIQILCPLSIRFFEA